ncbi:hypothetical protein ACLK19_20060 [Escherichia coli]
MALWLKKHRFRLDQVHELLPIAAGELNHHALHREKPAGEDWL